MNEQNLELIDVSSISSCDDCGELFQTVKQLYTHRRNHFAHYTHFCLSHFKNINYCPFCLYKFEYYEKEELEHSEMVKTDMKINITSFECSECSTETKDIFSLTDHYKDMHSINFSHLPLIEKSNIKSELKCTNCRKRFLYSCCLSSHKSMHTQKTLLNHCDLPLFKCKACPKQFLSNAMSIEHQFSHSNGKYFRCFICNCDFKFISTLKNHLVIHAQQYPLDALKCLFCSKIFSSPSGLKFHINKVHANESRNLIYSCDICDKYFTSKLKWNNHMIKTIHDGKQKFQCHECNMEFKFEKLIRKHLIRSHLEENQCFYCFKNFNKFFKLVMHTSTKHKCNLCPSTFMALKKLYLHIREHFKDNPKLCCFYCNTVYKIKSNYIKHMKDGHSFQCNACPKLFPTETQYICHSYEHSRMAEINCKFCSSFFYDNKLFVKHMKEAHNDVTPLLNHKYDNAVVHSENSNNNNYQSLIFNNHPNGAGLHCKICTKNFRALLYLRNHVIRSHLKLKKDYLCQLCNKKFKTRGAFNIHIKSHERTKLNDFYCENV